MDERTNEMYSDSGEALGYDLMKCMVGGELLVDFSGAFTLSDWLMLLSQHSMALRLLFPSFPADSADRKQLDSNSLESIEIESIAQILTRGLRYPNTFTPLVMYSMSRSTYQPLRSSDLVKFATSSPKLVNAYFKDLL
jgi:hypothetical protein